MERTVLQKVKSKRCASKWALMALLSVALVLLLAVNRHQARTLQVQRAVIRDVLDNGMRCEILRPVIAPRR